MMFGSTETDNKCSVICKHRLISGNFGCKYGKTIFYPKKDLAHFVPMIFIFYSYQIFFQKIYLSPPFLIHNIMYQ